MIGTKKRIKPFVFIAVLIVCTIIVPFVTSCSPDEAEMNAKSCSKAIVEFCKTDADTLKLADVTDFEWDAVYFFNGYTGASIIEQITGVKNNISPTYQESKHRLVFIKGDKVVCDLVFRHDITGFEFANEPYNISLSPEEAIFKIKREESDILLVYKGDKETVWPKVTE